MTNERSTILVVEDDRATRTFLADNLTADGYALLTTGSVKDGLRLIETEYPDLALVDLGLPDRDGLDLIADVRGADGIASRIDPRLPIVVLSGRAGELNRLRGWERGADLVVDKPFSYSELRAQIAALLWRSGQRPRSGRLRVGALEVDPAARIVTLSGERVDVSQREFALLRTLATDPTRVFTKEELLRNLWGYSAIGSSRTLDSHACRLRRRLARDGDIFIVSVWGIGYRLCDGAVAA